jgi:DNA-directed RNA polymerase specialized sigma24 family protein
MAFAMSGAGRAAALRMARESGLAWADQDDVCQDWLESLLRSTSRMRQGAPIADQIRDEADARGYALRALHNRIIDHFRKRDRGVRTIDLVREGDDDEYEMQLAAPDDADPLNIVVARRDHAAVAAAAQVAVLEQRVEIKGCRRELVLATALHLVALAYGDVRPRPVTWPETAFGDSPISAEDETFYVALELAAPGSVTFGDDGSVDARARQLKRRCAACVTRVLEEALNIMD